MLRSLIPRTEHVVISAIEDLSWAAKLLAVITTFFAPLHTIVALMMLFLLFDTASAIYLTYRIERERRKKCTHLNTSNNRKARLMWRIIDSDKLNKTIEKLFAYPVIAIGCFIVDRLVLGIESASAATIGKFSLTNFAFVLIVMIDFKSFLRNMGKATGNEIYRAIEKLLDRKFKDKFPHENDSEP